ncbi:SPX domain-containing protein 1 [Apostasia shenzhenica]|uniref:SPX domain-containing protein 1 n=1 Tax=Apostasia shenzhenica TaxID=1088818 RepID=A0A2H9ZTZ9_9ASPA|nr:SPX domain-containing protein 1 [Apostasia shenzhenica]
MKFGKSLSNQIEETLPEWRDKFLSYKDLKKRLKLIGATSSPHRPIKRPRLDHQNGTNNTTDTASPCFLGGGEDNRLCTAVTALTQEEEDFLNLLEAELDKFNTFFVEKEEEYIIRQKELQDRVAKATEQESKEEMMKVRKEIVNFHGEMVLLENYSALNYTGLVKILKKYDKRTGALIRLPFIQKVLQQPFFTTDLLYKLVKECEVMLDRLFPKKNEPSYSREEVGDDGGGGGSGGKGIGEQKPTLPGSSLANFEVPELEEIEYMESLYMKSTVSALRVLKEIRRGSSTVSVFSLPPLQSSGVDERWNNVPVMEQAAK